jgi:uncharacterized protein (DUF2141 family)
MIKSLFAAASLVASLPALAGPEQATLTIRFDHVTRHQGMVMIAVYDEAGWSGGRPVRVATAGAAGDAVEASLTGLAPGRYGIKVFQDVDGDGKMSANPFGIPIEPFGFSRDAMGAGGPPAWADAAFEMTAAGSVQTITLR